MVCVLPKGSCEYVKFGNVHILLFFSVILLPVIGGRIEGTCCPWLNAYSVALGERSSMSMACRQLLYIDGCVKYFCRVAYFMTASKQSVYAH